MEMAIALGNEPELLLLDEPTAGMSPEETASTIKLIKELASSEGLTILFTEHDLDVVFGIAEKLWSCSRGEPSLRDYPLISSPTSWYRQLTLGGMLMLAAGYPYLLCFKPYSFWCIVAGGKRGDSLYSGPERCGKDDHNAQHYGIKSTPERKSYF